MDWIFIISIALATLACLAARDLVGTFAAGLSAFIFSSASLACAFVAGAGMTTSTVHLDEGIVYTRLSDPVPHPTRSGVFLTFLYRGDSSSPFETVAYETTLTNIPNRFIVYEENGEMRLAPFVE